MAAQASTWQQELDDILQGFSGAFLFGVPLLFTMEMWWIGTYIPPWRLAGFLAVAFVVNVLLAGFTGFWRGSSMRNAVPQAVEAIAIGAVASFVVLAALNRIGPSDPFNEVIGKVVLQAIPLSIGASVANAIFGDGEGRQGEDDGGPQPSALRATINDLSATAAGGIFLGFSIAPTDEIKMLATEIGPWHEISLIGLSLLISYLIVFESEFRPSQVERDQPGPFQHPITETLVAYIVSLLVAFGALALFGQVTTADPLAAVLAQVVVLGFPTAIGGAAGRLVI